MGLGLPVISVAFCSFSTHAGLSGALYSCYQSVTGFAFGVPVTLSSADLFAVPIWNVLSLLRAGVSRSPGVLLVTRLGCFPLVRPECRLVLLLLWAGCAQHQHS